MSKASYKHPAVFFGCPYYPKKWFKALKKALDGVPLEFHFADSSIRTQHVLDRIRRGIVRTDYSLFDITGWNANVTLEVGLAEGLNENYYILFRPGRGAKSEPPADLKGVQRIQYKNIDGFSDDCLTYQLNHHLVRKLTHPRYIYDQLSGANREKEFIVAMRIIAHFKTQKVLRRKDLKHLAAGSWLRDETVEELLQLLRSRGLLKGRLDGQRWTAGRNLYKNISF